MDFNKILAAFSAIEGKQTLTEAEKKETTWTDMKGNKHPATQVKGDKYTGKEAEKEEKAKKVEEGKKKPDADGDGVPDWADKKPGKDDKTGKDVKESVGYKPVDMAALIARMDSIVEAEEKEADKDYDKDGKIESEKDEVIGSRRKAAGLDEAASDRPDAKIKDRTWTDKEGKKHPAKEVQGWQSVKGDKEADKEKKATMKEGQLDECGMMAGDAMGMKDSGMSVNTSIDTRTGNKTVSISADGEAADQLMQMLKLAGVGGMGGEEGPGPDGSPEHEGGEGEVAVVSVPLAHAEGGFKMGGEEDGEEEVEETYSNEPNPQTQGVDAQMQQGTDLNKQKQMVKHSYKQGDNPMAMGEAAELAALEAQLFEELDSIKVKRAK